MEKTDDKIAITIEMERNVNGASSNNLLEKFRSKLLPYTNTLVLMEFEVVRIKDVVDVPDDDLFWVCEYIDGSTVNFSCVISWSPLKGVIDESYYEHLLRIWELNIERSKE